MSETKAQEVRGSCKNAAHGDGHPYQADCIAWVQEPAAAPPQPIKECQIALEGQNANTCPKCGKPKFGPASTICSVMIGFQNFYCQCVEVFNGVADRPGEVEAQPPMEGGQHG